MKIKMIKNLFIASGIISCICCLEVVMVALLIVPFIMEGIIILPFAITLGAINLLFIFIFALTFKIIFETIHITDTEISTYLFSKKLISIRWDEVDDVELSYAPASRGAYARGAYVRVKLITIESCIELDINPKRLKILRQLQNINPITKHALERLRITPILRYIRIENRII